MHQTSQSSHMASLASGLALIIRWSLVSDNTIIGSGNEHNLKQAKTHHLFKRSSRSF